MGGGRGSCDEGERVRGEERAGAGVAARVKTMAAVATPAGVMVARGQRGAGGRRPCSSRRASATARAASAGSARAPCGREPPRWSVATSTAPPAPQATEVSRAAHASRPGWPRPYGPGAPRVTYDAPLLCCCSSVAGGDVRCVHGGLSTAGRVVTAPAGLRDPSGLHVHLYVWEIAALAVAR